MVETDPKFTSLQSLLWVHCSVESQKPIPATEETLRGAPTGEHRSPGCPLLYKTPVVVPTSWCPHDVVLGPRAYSVAVPAWSIVSNVGVSRK